MNHGELITTWPTGTTEAQARRDHPTVQQWEDRTGRQHPNVHSEPDDTIEYFQCDDAALAGLQADTNVLIGWWDEILVEEPSP